MTVEIIIVLGLVVLALVLFSTEKIPIDLTALLIMTILMVSGIISVDEGVSGFSNDATVTIAAMFVISGALIKTGFAEMMSTYLIDLFKKRGFWGAIIIMMLMVAVASAFVNNTPIVAVFLPVMLKVGDELNISGSKLLMPLSFAAIFGGTTTLIGTSTNILVSSIAKSRGLEPFGMFEFSELGLVFLVLGIAYMVFIGIRMIPERRKKEDLTGSFELREFISEVVILAGAKSIGLAIKDSPLVKDTGISIIEIHRTNKDVILPRAGTILNEGDILVVTGDLDKIKALQETKEVTWKHESKLMDADIATGDIMLIEAIISSNSFLIGRTLKSSNFRNRYRGMAIGLRHRGRSITSKIGTTRLQAGDALLIEVRKENFTNFNESNDFVFINRIQVNTFKREKMIPSLVVLAGVVTVAALGIASIVVSSIAGAVLLVLMRTITLEEAYKAIDWRVIFLLAGAITLGIALDKTGATMLFSNGIISAIGPDNPYLLIATFYFITFVLTSIMSNTATVALVAPIAIYTSESLGLDSRPLLIAVMFAASADFMTPIGYQTNTMIYSAGRYKFMDFVKIGTPLDVIFWITATLLIPILFPFK
jgi:di/tricarboxylate transporter